jgi:hypothetical protein
VLRITINETPTERRWILQGRLVGPWVAEVRTSWKKTYRDDDGRTCIIDLCDVTFIDKGGENLLRSMSKQGLRLVASGLYIKHIVDQLKPKSKSRPLRVISCLFAALLGGVIAPLSCTQASSERPKTNTVQGWTVELNSTNQRWGITAPSFFLKSKKEQHRAS